MALYRLYTIKRWEQAEWGNTYYVNAADAAAAATIGGNIAAIEAGHMLTDTKITGVRVSTAAADGRTGRTYPLSLTGALTKTRGQVLELCVRIRFFPGVKQPGAKYFHRTVDMSMLTDGNISGDAWSNTLDLAADLLGLGVIADQAGVIYTQAVPDQYVHTHQMYRAWAARAGADEGD